MWLKICGIREQDTWEACALAGASAVGFVFWQGSPRFITPGEAAAIGAPGAGIERVGVFCDASRQTIHSAVDTARLDWVQLHGSESVAFATSLGVPWVKAFRVGTGFDPGQVIPYCAGSFENRYILDARSGDVPGGTGKSFDWRLASRVGKNLPALSRLILSGGISIGNLGEAARRVAPFGVDLSSSVESSRGVKDPALICKLGALVRELRSDTAQDQPGGPGEADG